MRGQFGARPLRRGVIALAIVAVALATSAMVASGASARVLLVGSWYGVHGQFASIQGAVDAAKPGDWILIGPGDYHERGDRDRRYRSLAEERRGSHDHHAADPHARDGSQPRGHRRDQAGLPEMRRLAPGPGLGPRSHAKANGRNGIEVFKAAA